MAAARPTSSARPQQNQARPWQNNNSAANLQYGSGNRVPNPHPQTQPRFNANHGMQHEGYQNSFNGSVLSNRFYAPPPPPPRPPPPVSFIKPTNYNYSEPPLPPGTSELPPTSTVDSRSVGFSPIQPPPGPLLLPPLPPLFPYLSPKLAQSLHDGATQCGTSFVEESNNLPFIPVIIDDTDLKKMTESVKTQFEETRQQNLLLYEDIIDPSWPKELRDMFQPLYCKLCKLTLSSPVVARDHYKGKRHIRAGEVWIQENSRHIAFRRPQQQNNTHGPISGTIKPANGLRANGPPQPFSNQQQSFRGNSRAPFYQNQHGFDRSAPPPPPSYNNQNLKRNIGDDQQSEFIPAYRAALAGGPPRKRPKKEGGGGPNFAFCGLCNVHHTSAVTAEQHYAGKNHKAKLAANETGEPKSTQSQLQPFADDSSCGNFSSPLIVTNQQRFNVGDR